VHVLFSAVIHNIWACFNLDMAEVILYHHYTVQGYFNETLSVTFFNSHFFKIETAETTLKPRKPLSNDYLYIGVFVAIFNTALWIKALERNFDKKTGRKYWHTLPLSNKQYIITFQEEPAWVCIPGTCTSYISSHGIGYFGKNTVPFLLLDMESCIKILLLRLKVSNETVSHRIRN
jgi:hypothetical protein